MDNHEKEVIRKQLELLAEKSAVISKLSGHENLNHPNENSSNKYHRMRVAVRYKREPLYASTDWNYVRFDVNDVEYEYINGQLMLYCK